MSPIDLYTKEERKTNGVFYTPSFLAKYLTKKVLQYYGDRKITTVMDPACGDSILLRSFVREKDFLFEKPTIFGIDTDTNAIESSISKFSLTPFSNFGSNFIHTDGLFPIKNKTSLDGWKELQNKLNVENGFDIIVSNPPWGADKNEYDPSILKDFQLAKGQFDIFNLFVEVILKVLNENGIYGLILPDSIFNHEQSRLRCLLAKNTKIHLIARLGEKIFPEINRACVIIVGQNTKAENIHEVNCFRLSSEHKKKVISNELSLEEVEKILSHQVPQIRFHENDNCVFDIDLRIDEESTFNKIQNHSTPLKNYVFNTRGAEISKKGIVCQCPKCKQWTPYPRSKNPKCKNCSTIFNLDSVLQEKIILNHNGAGNIKLKVGEDLYRFTSVSKSWLNTLKEGINYKDLNIYNGEKILVRKTGVGITASIDYDNSITNQVVYILKLNPLFEKKITLEFILAILNSRAMTYHLIKKYGENEWRTHPYLTQNILINLPFPKIDFESPISLKYIKIVTEIVKFEILNSDNKNISKENDLIIEKIVSHFYNLNRIDYNSIFRTLSSSEQLIPIKRLLNCNTEEIFAIDGI